MEVGLVLSFILLFLFDNKLFFSKSTLVCLSTVIGE